MRLDNLIGDSFETRVCGTGGTSIDEIHEKQVHYCNHSLTKVICLILWGLQIWD
jgi:hypothetical protein